MTPADPTRLYYEQCVFGSVVSRRPFAISRNKIDISRIFAVAAPGVANIIKRIRAENVTPEPPAACEASECHLAGTETDLLDRTDIPALMVHPRMVRHNQREQMVIAAVRPVKEGDCGTAAVRQTEAKRLFIIIDRTTDIRDRKRVVEGQSVSVRDELEGR